MDLMLFNSERRDEDNCMYIELILLLNDTFTFITFI